MSYGKLESRENLRKGDKMIFTELCRLRIAVGRSAPSESKVWIKLFLAVIYHPVIFLLKFHTDQFVPPIGTKCTYLKYGIE